MAQNPTGTGSALGGLMGGLAQTGGTGTVYTYPQSYPTATVPQQPHTRYIPVIEPTYPEKLHFIDDTGEVHSFSVEDVYRRLGLKW